MLLRFLPVFSKLKLLGLVFFRSYQKAKGFTVLFGVFTVMNVMCINHALQIFTSLLGPPFDSLVYNEVVEDNIKQTIAKDAQPYSQ